MNIYPQEKNNPSPKKINILSKKAIAAYIIASSIVIAGIISEKSDIIPDCELHAETIQEIEKCQNQVQNSIKPIKEVEKEDEDDFWGEEIPGSMHGAPNMGTPY